MVQNASSVTPRGRLIATDRVVLLDRVRSLFRRLTWLMLVVEVIEWVDATSDVWPDRAVAAVALVAVVGWTLALKRSTAVAWWHDAWIVAAIIATGWGLGRAGAVLALLLGATLLRGLYGSRRSAYLGIAAILSGYVIVSFIIAGVEGVLDLGVVTVAVAIFSFASVIRAVAEVLARHDLSAAWMASTSAGVAALAAASDPHEVDTAVARVLTDLREVSASAGGGLIDAPEVPAVRVGHEPELAVSGDPEAAAELNRRLVRLGSDVRLASGRIGSEIRFRQLAEGSRDGIYLRAIGVRDELVYANSAAMELMSRVRPGSAHPHQVEMGMVHPADRDRLDQLIETNGYISEPVRFRLDGGEGEEDRWQELEELPASVGEHGVELVQGVVRDVTRQLEHERTLQNALDHEQKVAKRLRDVDELRTTFLAAVSHELRTPLAGLLGSAQTLSRHRERLNAEQTSDLAAAVERQGARLQRLLDDLLDVERLSQGLIVPNREPTRMVEVARTVVADQPRHAATVTVDAASDDVVIDVDRSQVERIIDNLVRNAIKHTPTESTIVVKVREHPDGVVLSVEDDGPGIPTELHTELFEPFAQGPDAARSASPGTGIGLSLVSRFAELHGGRAWIEDPSTGGARFHVFLSGSLTETELARVAVAREGAV